MLPTRCQAIRQTPKTRRPPQSVCQSKRRSMIENRSTSQLGRGVRHHITCATSPLVVDDHGAGAQKVYRARLRVYTRGCDGGGQGGTPCIIPKRRSTARKRNLSGYFSTNQPIRIIAPRLRMTITGPMDANQNVFVFGVMRSLISPNNPECRLHSIISV